MEKEQKKQIGQRLTDVRLALGYPTRPPFAAVLNIPADTLGSYERGIREPDLSLLGIYGDRFGVNLNWLASGKGQMFSEPEAEASRNLLCFPDLIERLHDRVADVYNDLGQKPPHRRIAREAASLYNELAKIVQDMGDAEMVEAALPMVTLELKRRLERAAAEPGTGKRSA